MQRLHVGQPNQPIVLKIWDDAINGLFDLTGYTAIMRFRKPNKTIVDVAAAITLPTTGELSYTPTVTTFLDKAGVWQVQGIASKGDGTNVPTSITSFVVAENLPT